MSGLRPFFPFYGSKWNIARHYPPPTHDVVVEPFAGGGGYSTFYGAKRVHLYDVDPIVAGVWSYLLRVTPAEILALPDLPNVGDSVDDHALPQEAKWLIGFWLNRGSAQPKKSRTAYSARTDKAQLNWSPRAKERIVTQLPALERWTMTNASYEDADNGEATWFVDPPYGEMGKHYRFKFSDFAALGPWCQARQGQVIVCEGAGASWLPFHELGSFKSTRGRAAEVVYVREAPEQRCAHLVYDEDGRRTCVICGLSYDRAAVIVRLRLDIQRRKWLPPLPRSPWTAEERAGDPWS